MARNFKELRAKMSPESQARSHVKAQQIISELALDELREARNLTQENLALVLRVKQAAISKMEHRADMYISTLKSYIQAMGGDLKIEAVFPDGRVTITQFENLGKGASAGK
jgi:DNA-binding transcriptional regulator YiaG